MLSFDQAAALYAKDDLSRLAADRDGLRFLLGKTLIRKEYAADLARVSGVDTEKLGIRAWERELFQSETSASELKSLIDTKYTLERATRLAKQDSLVAELYKMRSFDWGGLHQNSLEKTIVDNYVKKIADFDNLNEEIDSKLTQSLRGYVQCSWYNHWTSIIIEDLFKDHDLVTPALGLIKKIDFFIKEIPFDLKVTYIPEGFIKELRREAGHRPETTVLKQVARKFSLSYDRTLSSARLLEVLWETCADAPHPEAKDTVTSLEDFRKEVAADVRENPARLIRWLYENQGVRRFDASNRLFLVLTKKSNFFESWKLKRAAPSLKVHIDSYLDSFDTSESIHSLDFDWEGSTYEATAGLILVDE